MFKYDLLENIKSMIKNIENYRDDSFVYAHLTGIMSTYLTDEQMADIHDTLFKELELKQISDELKYELEAGK